MTLDRSLLFLFLTSPNQLPASQEDQLSEASIFRRNGSSFAASSFFPLAEQSCASSLRASQIQISAPSSSVAAVRPYRLTTPRTIFNTSLEPYTGLTTTNKMSSPVKARAANSAATAVENEIDVYSASHIYYGPDAHHKQHNHFRTRTYSTVSFFSCFFGNILTRRRTRAQPRQLIEPV